MKTKRIILANPHGFCAGVRRAMDTIENVLRRFPAPVYCLKELVHNRQVVDELADRGVRFVKEIDEVPVNGTVIFSAHGVGPAVREKALVRNLRVIDATCPFVSKVHNEVKHYAAAGYTILLIGHRNHDEVIGVRGEAPDRVHILENRSEAESVIVEDKARVAVVTQTTLSVQETEGVMDVLRGRFPELVAPPKSDICFATEGRQAAVRHLRGKVDALLVLGSENSSNTRRLVEVAAASGLKAFLVSTEEALCGLPIEDCSILGLAAGASTPESFVDRVIVLLQERGFDCVESMESEEETTHFSLPAELK